MEILRKLSEIQKEAKILSRTVARYQKLKEKEDLAKIEKFLATFKKSLGEIKDQSLMMLAEKFLSAASEDLKRQKNELRERFGREIKELTEREGWG